MTIISEIQRWAEAQPAWQHVIAILYEQTELSPDAFEDVYTLLKSAKGIPGEAPPAHRTLTREQVAVSQIDAAVLQLVTVKDLVGVNVMASSSTVT